MPAKKKRPTPETDAANNVRLRKRLGELLTDHFKDVDRIRDLENQLKKATEPDPDALNMGEYAEDLRRKLVAEKRELEFWVEESDRFRNQVVELLRWQAQRVKPGELE